MKLRSVGDGDVGAPAGRTLPNHKLTGLEAEVAARIGGRMRARRLTLGMSLAALSIKVGCSQALLSRVERGQNLPSVPTLLRIAMAYGASIGSLVDP